MGYADDLIARLRETGVWDQLTSDQQRRFRNLTDEQARQMMVMDDQWEMGEQKAIEAFGVLSLVQMIGAFQGALVERGPGKGGKLSPTGTLLAEFFRQLRERGVSVDQIAEELHQLSPLAIAAIIAAHQRPDESG
jgi:hypothetical protein